MFKSKSTPDMGGLKSRRGKYRIREENEQGSATWNYYLERRVLWLYWVKDCYYSKGTRIDTYGQMSTEMRERALTYGSFNIHGYYV